MIVDNYGTLHGHIATGSIVSISAVISTSSQPGEVQAGTSAGPNDNKAAKTTKPGTSKTPPP